MALSLGPWYTEGINTACHLMGQKGKINVRSKLDISANEIILPVAIDPAAGSKFWIWYIWQCQA